MLASFQTSKTMSAVCTFVFLVVATMFYGINCKIASCPQGEPRTNETGIACPTEPDSKSIIICTWEILTETAITTAQSDVTSTSTTVSGLKVVEEFQNELSKIEASLRKERDPVSLKDQAEALYGRVNNFALNFLDSPEFISESSDQARMKIIGKVLTLFETSGPLLASTLPVGNTSRNEGELTKSLMMNVDLSKGNETSGQLDSDGFLLTTESIRHLSFTKMSSMGLSAVVFKNLSSILSAANIDSRDGPTVTKSALHHNVFNTRLLMVSLNIRDSGSISLSENATITFKLLQTSGVTRPVCLSLSGGRVPDFRTEGCTAQLVNDTHALCNCNHLTSFAIVMSVVDSTVGGSNTLALDVLTYICCSLSIVFLVISFVTFVSFKALESQRNTIHINLALCLALGQLLFLIGVNQTANQVVCAVFAGLLHYVFLATFGWMAVEGLHIYLKLVLVFEMASSMTPHFMAIGYGIPAVIVGVAAGIFHKGYGTKKYCWLSKEKHFHWSFLGPVILIIAINFVMLGIALVVMCRHFRSPAKRDLSDMAKLRQWLRGSVSLTCLLGLTWVFGLFHLSGSSTVVFAYIFVLLNGSQGVFIFFFHCFGNDKVKKEYRQAIRRASWMPDGCRHCFFQLFRTESAADISETTGQTAQKGTLTHLQGDSSARRLSATVTTVQSVTLHPSPSRTAPKAPFPDLPPPKAPKEPEVPPEQPAQPEQPALPAQPSKEKRGSGFGVINIKSQDTVKKVTSGVQETVEDEHEHNKGFRMSLVEVPAISPEMVASAGIYMGDEDEGKDKPSGDKPKESLPGVSEEKAVEGSQDTPKDKDKDKDDVPKDKDDVLKDSKSSAKEPEDTGQPIKGKSSLFASLFHNQDDDNEPSASGATSIATEDAAEN